MDNYEKNRVVLQLRDVVLTHLVVTPYGSDDPDYAVKQYHEVCDHIKKIELDHPSVLQAVLNSHTIIIPSVEDVEGVEDDGKNRRMQNIATSASLCIELLWDEQHRSYVSDQTRLVVDMFLKSVKIQAQQAAKANSHTASAPKYYIDLEVIKREIAETINLRFQEYLENNKDEGTGLDNYFKTQKEIIEKSLNDISNQAANAKSAADVSRDIAKSIKESAKNAEKSAENARNAAAETLQNIKEATTAATNATSAATNATSAATKATDAANEAKDTAKEMLPNMLSALGILVGIVVAVVGCYLSILLAEHSNDIKSFIGYSRPFEFARYLLMGQTTTMVVFLLMYLISRISGHTLSCSCNRFDAVVGYDKSIHDCTKCTRKCGVQKRFVWRYPYLFGINFACCVGYVVLAIWQFINIYFRESLDNWIISLGFWRCLQELIVLILLLTVATVTVVAIIVFSYKLIKWILSLMKS